MQDAGQIAQGTGRIRMWEDSGQGDGVFDFDELANHLLEQGSSVSPSRLHGCLSGLLSAGANEEPEYALDALGQALDTQVHGELAERVMQLYRVTALALVDEEFAFYPLLPDDEDELAERTEALADWCSGFLAGFAYAGAAHGTPALSPDSKEVMTDLAAIAQATVGDDEDDEAEDDAENSYQELVEYLRFAVLNVFMDGRASVAEAEAGDSAPVMH